MEGASKRYIRLSSSLEWTADEYVQTYYVNTLDEFKKKLLDHEVQTNTKFVLRKSEKRFNEDIVLSENLHIRWKDDVPYFHFGSRLYTCHLGKDGNISQKKKYALHREMKECIDHIFTKRYNRAQLTKKLDCPAVIKLVRIVRMPQYKLVGSLTKQFEKRKMVNIIKRKIVKGKPVGEECFMFNLPDIADHKYHFIGASEALPEPIDFRVKDYIASLVQKGERNGVVISKLLEDYVEKELKETDRRRKRFYPDLTTIRSIIYRNKANLIKNKTVQESIENIVDEPDDSEGDDLACSELNNDVLLVYESNDTNYKLSSPSSSFDNKLVFRQQVNLNEGTSPVDILKLTEKQNETLHLKGGLKRPDLDSCYSTIQSIQSTMWYLDEDKLETLAKTLEDLFLKISREVKIEEISEDDHKPSLPASSSKLQLIGKKRTGDRIGITAKMVNSSHSEIDEDSADTNNLLYTKKAKIDLKIENE